MKSIKVKRLLVLSFFLTVGYCSQATASPAAIITANTFAGNVDVLPNDKVTLHWNANGATVFSSTLSQDGAAPSPWIANTANGDYIMQWKPNQAGHQFTFTYVAKDPSSGLTATATVTVIVAKSQTLAVTVFNQWTQPATYAQLMAYPADFSSAFQVGYWPNLKAQQPISQKISIPAGFPRFWGTFYFYNSTEFHDVACQANFSQTPASVKLILSADFSSCQIVQ